MSSVYVAVHSRKKDPSTLALAEVSSFLLKVFPEPRFEGVTTVQTVKPPKENNVCDLGF